MQLAKIAQFRHGQVIAGQMQQRVLQHRAMPVGQEETIAIRPLRICRIVAQVPIPQCDGDFSHSHRHAGMARFCGFHGVHCQCADRVCQLLVGGALARGGNGHFRTFQIDGCLREGVRDLNAMQMWRNPKLSLWHENCAIIACLVLNKFSAPILQWRGNEKWAELPRAQARTRKPAPKWRAAAYEGTTNGRNPSVRRMV